MEKQEFYIEGKNSVNSSIKFYFEGDFDSCVQECKQTLALIGGGYLRIFLLYGDYGVFILKVEN